MTIHKIVGVVIAISILSACSRSKEPHLYTLNPIPVSQMHVRANLQMQIGIDKVSLPLYLEKTQLLIYGSAHRLILNEDEQWAESLDKNIMRVIETNLSLLLPKAVVNSSPWDSLFKPTYHLQVSIREFTIDCRGHSVLRAEYFIYHDEKLTGKYNFYHVQKTPVITTENLVISMNYNLTRLTRAIAHRFATVSE